MVSRSQNCFKVAHHCSAHLQLKFPLLARFENCEKIWFVLDLSACFKTLNRPIAVQTRGHNLAKGSFGLPTTSSVSTSNDNDLLHEKYQLPPVSRNPPKPTHTHPRTHQSEPTHPPTRVISGRLGSIWVVSEG